MDRAESLMDHLAADENLMLADEQQGHGSNGQDKQPPRAHSLEHDAALEQVRCRLGGLLHYAMPTCWCIVRQ